MTTALEKGVALGKANRRKEAIEYLKQALLENPREVEAWMWISQLVDDRPTQKYCYKKILEIDPNDFMANQFLGILKDTDANLKFFPEPISPLQTFFENQQVKQVQSQVRKPFPLSASSPSMRPAIAPLQNSRLARPQSKPKKKGISPWVSSFLILTVIIAIISIMIPALIIPLSPYILPFIQAQDPTLPPLSADELATGREIIVIGGVAFGWTLFMWLFSFLSGAYWMVSGYVGAYLLIKKGYVLELVGCAILAAGIPLLLPAVLGPIMYWWGNSVQEKNR